VDGSLRDRTNSVNEPVSSSLSVQDASPVPREFPLCEFSRYRENAGYLLLAIDAGNAGKIRAREIILS